MSIASEDRLIDDLEIRDTSGHTSGGSENRGFIPKTIVVHNHLDKQVSVQLQGDVESGFSNPITIGAPIVVGDGDDEYATLTDYFPFFRVVATCSVTPTSGDVSVILAKVGA